MPAELADLNRAYVLHLYTSIALQQERGPRVQAGASGVGVRDETGRERIDAMAGPWCVADGYGREEIAEAIAHLRRALDRLADERP